MPEPAPTCVERPDGSGTGPQAPSPFGTAYLLITVALVALVSSIAFEAMAISTAMPSVARDLDAVRSYGLAFSVMLTTQLLGIVLAGVWADRSGAVAPLMVGVLLFGGGSLLCALAPALGLFLAGRAVAGLGGGLVIVSLYVVIGRVYPSELQPRLFGIISAAWVLPSLVGPPIAAAITEGWSWRWVFGLVTILVVAVGLALLGRRGRLATADDQVAPAAGGLQPRRRLMAGLLVAASAGALQWGTHELEPRWSPQIAVALLGALGLVMLAPVVVPWRTWVLGRGLPSVYLARFLSTAAFFGSTTYLPLLLTQDRGVSLSVAGLVVAAGSVGWASGSWIQGRPSLDGRRHRLVSLAGAALGCGIGGLALVAWTGLPWAWCVPAMCLGGLGMGLASSAVAVLALQLAPIREHGMASSTLMMADTLGSVLGIATTGAVFAAGHDPAGDGPLFGAIWTVLGALVLLLVPAGQRIRT